jgi:hypothetical protein
MGGMGMGMRSIPPTGLPETTLRPKQTRHLPTVVASLNGPDDEDRPLMPAKGEELRISEIGQLTDDARSQKALKRLAIEKAPRPIAQLVLWNVVAGLDWAEIARRSKSWANPYEIALAKQFVGRLDQKDEAVQLDPGILYWEVTVKGEDGDGLAAELRKLLTKSAILGLRTKGGIPQAPEGPAIALRATIDGTAVNVSALSSDESGAAWVKQGAFALQASELVAADKPAKERATALADAMASGLLDRLVRAEVTKGPRVKGKLTYKVRIDNASPLVLNGWALAGADESKATPTPMSGFCVPPRRSFSWPATSEMVEALKLKQGVRVTAIDLSGL